MIPLNKPGRVNSSSCGGNLLEYYFPQNNTYLLSTASDALNVIYKRLFEEKGSIRVGVSPLVCFQAIYPIVCNGHVPVFMDINPDTFNLDVNKLNDYDIQALEVIHLGGNPNEMDTIIKFANTRGIPVIEDCAQALGAKYDERYLGNYGDFAAFSLIKNLHAPSGGLLVSVSDLSSYLNEVPEMGSLLRMYRKTKIYLEGMANHHPLNIWNLFYWGLMTLKGVAAGYSLSKDVHQLKSGDVEDIKRRFAALESLLHRRSENAIRIIQDVDCRRAKVQVVPERGVSNWNRIMFKLVDKDAEEVIGRLRREGIAANNLTQNYKHGFQPHVSKDRLLARFYQVRLEAYENLLPHIISVPSSPFLKEDEIRHISRQMNSILS